MKELKDLRILVLGDIILDEYIEGTVTRISPEAPIPILDKKRSYYRLGGASNVSKNVVSLGAYVLQMGRIGLDSYGELIHAELEKSKIDTTGVICDASVPTILKTRFVCDSHQLLRVDYEDKRSIEGTEIGDSIRDYIEWELERYDAIIVSDYQKGIIYPALAERIGEICREKKIIAVVDTHKKDWGVFKNYTCITPNKKELEIAVNAKLNSLEEVKEAAETVRAQLKLQYLLVTLSENGMLIVTSEGSQHIPINAVNVVDVTGCGDTAIAVFTAMLASGRSALESAQFANKAAGIVCGKMGTAFITPQELLA